MVGVVVPSSGYRKDLYRQAYPTPVGKQIGGAHSREYRNTGGVHPPNSRLGRMLSEYRIEKNPRNESVNAERNILWQMNRVSESLCASVSRKGTGMLLSERQTSIFYLYNGARIVAPMLRIITAHSHLYKRNGQIRTEFRAFFTLIHEKKRKIDYVY